MKKNSLHDVLSIVNIQDRTEILGDFIKDQRLDYKPSYQRDYVWPPFKGSYFMETILLHAEFTPIAIIEHKGVREVIDGRQRVETIDKFLKDQLTLKSTGLDVLWNLSDKKWSQFNAEMQDRILASRIRIIVIRFNNPEEEISPDVELAVKRELFRRYNLGMTPLKKVEVYKAQYLQDPNINYFKKKFKNEEEFYTQVNDIFNHRSKNIEILMQTIRQLLILHRIPINKYSMERDYIVNRYYDFMSFENRGNEQAREIYSQFKEKMSFLYFVYQQVNKETKKATGLVYECLFWALSVLEVEKINFRDQYDELVKKLVKFVTGNINTFILDRSNQAPRVYERYEKVAKLFSAQFRVDFGKYLKNESFAVAHKERLIRHMKEKARPGMEQEHFSKLDPTSTTIKGIISLMQKRKFDLRPSYQREEVISVPKASALIESILKGLSLHPIYVYIRTSGCYEVIDGQQRLLAILAFIGERYMTQDGDLVPSKNDGFALRLKTGMMQDLDHATFEDLSLELRNKILDFKISMIEIRQELNPNFRPEELFKRLNYKPFPIREHSFEFWNAYANPEIIKTIKELSQKNSWLYFRKNNSRMMNEELLMHLIYFEYATMELTSNVSCIKEVLSIKFSSENISIQVKNKASITRVIENDILQQEYLNFCKNFDTNFLSKVKTLVSFKDSKNTNLSMARQLDSFLHTNQTSNIRTATQFWLFWAVLKGIPTPTCFYHRDAVRKEMEKMFEVVSDAVSVDEFERALTETWTRLKKIKMYPYPLAATAGHENRPPAGTF